MTIDPKIKTAAGKPPFELVPWQTWALIFPRSAARPALYHVAEGVAWALRYGELKYAPYSYARANADAETFARYMGAYWRHYLKAETHGVLALDDESGLPHLIHALANLIILGAILCASAPMDISDERLPVTGLHQDYFGRFLLPPDAFGANMAETARLVLALARDFCLLHPTLSLCALVDRNRGWIRTPLWAPGTLTTEQGEK